MIAQLLSALSSYWTLKAKRLRLDTIEQAEKESNDLQKQIDALDAAGNFAAVHGLLVSKARRAALLEGLADAAPGDDLHQQQPASGALGVGGNNSGKGSSDPRPVGSS